jgi:hypothetical protein
VRMGVFAALRGTISGLRRTPGTVKEGPARSGWKK